MSLLFSSSYLNQIEVFQLDNLQVRKLGFSFSCYHANVLFGIA